MAILTGNDNNDTLIGTSDGDYLYGHGGADTLRGGGGADWLEGGAGRDSLYGGEGNDGLEGGDHGDLLDGGPGRDEVSYWRSNAGVKVDLSPETDTASGGHAEGDTIRNFEDITGSPHADTLKGDDESNALYGRGGADMLRGEGGNDWIEGGPRGDSLYGGAGNDTAAYWRSNEGVSVNLAAGTASRGHAAGDTLDGIEHLAGSFRHGDTLTGDSGSNDLYGYGGADVLHGGGGADRLYGENGADRLHGDEGADSLYGGEGNDVLEGGYYGDLLDGGPGDDTVSYARSPYGVAVDLSEGRGYYAEAGGDRIRNVEKVVGSQSNDVLTGSSGADTLEGGAGADWLIGGAGADWLAGGAGADTLWGGAEADLFAFVAATDSTSGTRDLIKDFKSSEGDQIDLSDLAGFGATSMFIAGRAFSNRAGEVRYEQVTESGTAYTDVFGDADGNGAADFVVRLVGSHDLTAGDFYLGGS